MLPALTEKAVNGFTLLPAKVEGIISAEAQQQITASSWLLLRCAAHLYYSEGTPRAAKSLGASWSISGCKVVLLV